MINTANILTKRIPRKITHHTVDLSYQGNSFLKTIGGRQRMEGGSGGAVINSYYLKINGGASSSMVIGLV
jgi:hypothetical protein